MFALFALGCSRANIFLSRSLSSAIFFSNSDFSTLSPRRVSTWSVVCSWMAALDVATYSSIYTRGAEKVG